MFFKYACFLQHKWKQTGRSLCWICTSDRSSHPTKFSWSTEGYMLYRNRMRHRIEREMVFKIKIMLWSSKPAFSCSCRSFSYSLSSASGSPAEFWHVLCNVKYFCFSLNYLYHTSPSSCFVFKCVYIIKAEFSVPK